MLTLALSPLQTRNANVPLSRFGARIVHDVASMFQMHAQECTTCHAMKPCREGDAVVNNFLKTSASYFNTYTK